MMFARSGLILILSQVWEIYDLIYEIKNKIILKVLQLPPQMELAQILWHWRDRLEAILHLSVAQTLDIIVKINS